VNELIIEKTKETPEINFNPNSGVLKMSGRAYSNDIYQFYKPLNFWLEEYLINPKDTTVIDIKLEYCNSVFNKLLLAFFVKCKSVIAKDKKIIINWYHEKDDKDSLDDANRISRIIQLEITKIEFD